MRVQSALSNARDALDRAQDCEREGRRRVIDIEAHGFSVKQAHRAGLFPRRTYQIECHAIAGAAFLTLEDGAR
ncbi:hypothetical protein D3C71_1861700 [compost metagenome]